MAASPKHLLARAVQRRQDTLRDRPKAAGMPPVIKPGIWEQARGAWFNERPRTRAEILGKQMSDAGMK